VISSHVYRAFVAGSELELSVKGGTISLNAGRSPHVQASITVASPESWGSSSEIGLFPGFDVFPGSDVFPGIGASVDESSAAPDPRLGARIRVEVDGEYPSFSRHREFDLALRSRTIDQASGEVDLDLTSDEALLDDIAPAVDDPTPLAHQDSLVDIVDYVLGKVIPGAALEPGPDVPVPALAASTNLIRNPRVGLGITDWFQTGGTVMGTTRYTTGGPSGAPTYIGYQAPSVGTTNAQVFLDQQVISTTPGRLYVLSAYVRAYGARQVSLTAQLFDEAGNTLGFAGGNRVTPAGSWVRISTSFYGGSRIRPALNAIGGLAGSEFWDVTGWRLSESTGDPVADALYFDGDTTDTALYRYAFQDDAHASLSQRTVVIDAATPDALTWRTGQTALDFLMPLVQRFGFRLVCDETRTWTLRDENYTAPGQVTFRHAVNLTDGRDTISLDSGLWFDAALRRYRWKTPEGVERERVDYYSASASPIKVDTREIEAAYPGPGRAQYAVRRAQGRGREVAAASVADWSAQAEQSGEVLFIDAPKQVGNTQSVVFDLSNDEMTVTLRTLELAIGSVDRLTGTVNALTGTVNDL